MIEKDFFFFLLFPRKPSILKNERVKFSVAATYTYSRKVT